MLDFEKIKYKKVSDTIAWTILVLEMENLERPSLRTEIETLSKAYPAFEGTFAELKEKDATLYQKITGLLDKVIPD